jgi:hypothetical protein
MLGGVGAGEGDLPGYPISQHGPRRWATFCFYPLSFTAFSCFVVSSFEPRLAQRRNMPLQHRRLFDRHSLLVNL